MEKKIFSGVQPTGNLHLGNYLGAIKNLFKILFASILMSFAFKYLIFLFGNKLIYDYELKLFYLILVVIFALILYLLISFLIKALNYKDLKLKY